PNIMRGIAKLRKLPNIPLIVTKMRFKKGGKNVEHIIPKIIAIIILGSSPNLNGSLKVISV
ncbi:MAG: hypothetical protein IIW25_06985, partial [Bacteroidales bacterium]|nr:hypothetical protein [Bacteroidales bacterium]